MGKSARFLKPGGFVSLRFDFMHVPKSLQTIKIPLITRQNSPDRMNMNLLGLFFVYFSSVHGGFRYVLPTLQQQSL
jgi:hypothetical protein